MGVCIEAYCTRIDTFMKKCIKEHTTGVCEDMMMGNHIWFMGLRMMMMITFHGSIS
jgi:hypothetical protein